MMKLVLASANEHKINEIKKILPASILLVGLNDIGCNEEIPETSNTLEGNALQKASHVFNNYNCNCFADDTGLEVEALNNEPGVYSARYAGAQQYYNDSKAIAQANMEKLLVNLDGIINRKAAFRTVIALILDGHTYYFEGKIEGIITQAPRGNDGFGYDPLFMPTGYTKTFAELTLEEKNKISHRAIATKKLCNFLSEMNN